MKTITQLQDEIAELQINKLIVGKKYDANVLAEIENKKKQVLELYEKELKPLRGDGNSLYRVTE
jgi:hypothetical protein